MFFAYTLFVLADTNLGNGGTQKASIDVEIRRQSSGFSSKTMGFNGSTNFSAIERLQGM